MTRSLNAGDRFCSIHTTTQIAINALVTGVRAAAPGRKLAPLLSGGRLNQRSLDCRGAGPGVQAPEPDDQLAGGGVLGTTGSFGACGIDCSNSGGTKSGHSGLDEG